jgi:NTP pyrophosphatase (non-canonical NTP hydrolase)
MTYPVDMNDRAREIHDWAVGQGFWEHAMIDSYATEQVENPSIGPEKLALIHSEVSEALEGMRNGDEANVAEEMADIVIRVLDFCGWKGINIEQEVVNKMAKNRKRPRLHGRVF